MEADLTKPVADWLRANGYPVVYAEIGRGPIDLVGWDQAGDRIACVELKVAFTRKVLKQAMLAQLVTPYAYAAAGTRPREASLAKARKAGLGVLSVRDGTVTVLCEPNSRFKPFKPHRDEMIEDLLRSEPSDCGGVPCRAGIGPAQECAKAIREFLGERPEADWRTIFAEVPNHYASFRSMAQVMNRRFGIFLKRKDGRREVVLMDDWKPIETAPKDETEIIVGWWQAGVWMIRSARWVEGAELESQGIGDWAAADTGWWSYRHSVTQEKLQDYETPTHWIPMPEPPEMADGAASN